MSLEDDPAKNTLRKLYLTLLRAVYTSCVGIYWSVTSTFMNPILKPHLGPAQLIWSPDDEDEIHTGNEFAFLVCSLLL